MTFSEFGHYLYRESAFVDKPSAMAAAKLAGDDVSRVHLYFHDDAFADCTVEPEASLAELYRARAQELRDRYDYLILMYSGGADSHQVLMAFLRNGIHLDEVRTHCPMGFAEKLDDAIAPDHPLGLLLEFRRQATPGLRLIQQVSPQTAIVPVDTTAAYTVRWDENWLEGLCAWPRPTGSLFNAVRRNSEASDLQRRADQLNRPVAVIYGVEKPYLRLLGNDVCFGFTDVARVGIYNVFVNGGRPLFDTILFFWGSPPIVIKQAHVIKRALERSPAALSFVRATGWNIYLDTGIPDIDLSLIYPDWLRQPYTKVERNNTTIISSFLDVPAREFTTLRHKEFAGRKLASTTWSRWHRIGTLNNANSPL